MDHTKVNVFQEANQKVLCSFLQSQDHMPLEVQIILANFLGDFRDQMQDGELAYEELSALLELADLAEGYYPWPVPLGTLQQTSLQKLISGSLASQGQLEFLLGWLLPADISVPTSVSICTSCLVGIDPGNCPAPSSFFTSSLCLSTLLGVWGSPAVPDPMLSSLEFALHSGGHLHPSHTGMKNQPIRCLGRLFKRHVPFCSFSP